MQPPIQGAADYQPQAACRHMVRFGPERLIDEIDLGGEVGDVSGIEEVPWLPVGIDLPTGYQACVRCLQSVMRGPRDLAIRFGYKEAASLIDCQTRRSDRDL